MFGGGGVAVMVFCHAKQMWRGGGGRGGAGLYQ